MNRDQVKAIGGAAAALATVGLLGACGSSSSSDASSSGGGSKTYNLRIGAVVADSTTQYAAAKQWADQVDKDTSGKVKITIYPNSQLGAEDTELTSVTKGALDGELVATAILEQQVKQISVLDLPYVFDDPATEEKLLNGPLGKQFSDLLEKKNIHVLAWTTLGTRDVLSTKKIASVGDMDGVSIRVPNSPAYLSSFKALGADPAPIAVTEVYTGLQSGVVNAIELAPEQLVGFKFYEVAKNLALTKHSTAAQALVLNSGLWSKLPAEYQEILQRDAQTAASAQWEKEDSTNEKAIETMKSAGVNVEDVDTDAFASKVASFNHSYADSIGAQTMLATIESAQ